MQESMRYTFFVLLVVSLACSKAEPKSEAEPDTAAAPATAPEAEAPPAPEAPSASPEPEPETKPLVTLVTAGKPPLKELRRTFAAGDKETMSFRVDETITMKGPEWDTRSTPLARVQTIDIEIASVSDDGVAEVTLRVRETEEVAGSVKEPNTKQMDTSGVTGRYKINTEGVMTELGLEPPPNDFRVQKSFLGSMRSKLRMMAPAFPKEPVGVGAKWTVTTEVNEFLTRLHEEVTVELVKRTDSEIVLRFEVKSAGSRHHDFKPPQDVTVDVETRGRAKLRLNELVPRSSKLEQQIVQTATLLGPDAPDEPVIQTLTHTVKIRAK